MKIFWSEKIIITVAFACCMGIALFFSPSPVFAGPDQVAGDEAEWTNMPEGGKPAFVGMQGGTVPASVYYTDDGAETTTQAGLGSNDFLDAVHGNSQPLSAENLVPFGFVDETNATNNLASGERESLPDILPYGVVKIYDQEFENDSLLLTSELTRI